MGVKSEVAGEQIHKVPLEKCCRQEWRDFWHEAGGKPPVFGSTTESKYKFGLQFAGILMLFFSLQVGLQERGLEGDVE